MTGKRPGMTGKRLGMAGKRSGKTGKRLGMTSGLRRSNFDKTGIITIFEDSR